jgi:hypothetical protein
LCLHFNVKKGHHVNDIMLRAIMVEKILFAFERKKKGHHVNDAMRASTRVSG